MAFLCPVRIKRNKKKKPLSDESFPPGLAAPSMGRITGSASIETLVRVGLEKEHGLSPDSKMVVLHDFKPCVDDELEVKRGQVVHVLYQENDWVYVIAELNRSEGFIPHSYCAPFNSQLANLALNVKKKLPREPPVPNNGTNNLGTIVNSNAGTATNQLGNANSNITGNNIGNNVGNTMGNNTNNNSVIGAESTLHVMGLPSVPSAQQSGTLRSVLHTDVAVESQLPAMSTSSSSSSSQPFVKEALGRYIVLYSYPAQDENDVSVERGQCVTVLNTDDPEWFWVSRYDNAQGFVPASFIYPLDAIQRQQTSKPPAAPKGDQTLPKGSGLEWGTSPISANLTVAPKPLNSKSLSLNSGGESSAPSSLGVHNSVGLPQLEERRSKGAELVILYDYKAQAPDDLSVVRGDWVYADLTNQTVDGWLWCYAPRTKAYGFIPKAYARPPAMTSL